MATSPRTSGPVDSPRTDLLGDLHSRRLDPFDDPGNYKYADVHRRFVKLWNERTSRDAGAITLDTAWQPIANLLDGHASADTAAAHPNLLMPDSGKAPNKPNSGRPAQLLTTRETDPNTALGF